MIVIDRIEEVLREMVQSDPSPSVREAASSALDRLSVKRSLESLLESLKNGSLQDRMRIVHSAGDIGGNEGVALLLAALSDPDDQVRGAAARGLEISSAVPVLKALADRLPKEQGVVLGNIIETLGKARRKELAPVIGKYIGHPDPFVCGKAVRAYALVAEKDGWEKIILQAGSDSATVRAAVAEALAEWSDERG